LGFSDDIESIANYCKENNILIIEDNCESLWSELKWKKLWNFSIASTFSFFVWHHMSCIEWWIISTDDKALYNEFLKVRAHWWDRNLDKSSQEEIRTIYGVNNFYSKYTFYDLWYNIRPTEITWFLWNLQINFLDEIIDIREKNFNFFHNIISKNNNFYKLNISLSRVSNFAYPIICKDKNIFNKYLKLLNDKNIEVRPIVWWLMTEQPFFKKYNDDCYVLENSKLIHELWFYFWNNPELTIDELDYIVNIFKND
jgi:CDP-6-deoxy-D-xylo-4-hexulose-3-dehydrase